ncbi:hypothetical protein Sfum_3357 [Syntrophobacter fumaroxidans MPOB]|uniref:Uncharacterized protein n=1 Tax=Syntrophobacter fumaroxidans (strain DSM 10017 / MPOB) TaxID=335543 RepID=A0LNM8_SYNFM|nr:hypothetical protein Sfum_3357 [Syntrophobacter fumaroxidans MPOB]
MPMRDFDVSLSTSRFSWTNPGPRAVCKKGTFTSMKTGDRGVSEDFPLPRENAILIPAKTGGPDCLSEFPLSRENAPARLHGSLRSAGPSGFAGMIGAHASL